MRSFLIHLWNTTLPAVEAALPEKLLPNPSIKEFPGKWILKVDNDYILHIDSNEDGPMEFEDWSTRFPQGVPAVSLCLYLSDDHDAYDQTRDLILWILSKFQGVAEDDSAFRFWTREEIQADQPIDDQKFGAWRNYLQY